MNDMLCHNNFQSQIKLYYVQVKLSLSQLNQLTMTMYDQIQYTTVI